MLSDDTETVGASVPDDGSAEPVQSTAAAAAGLAGKELLFPLGLLGFPDCRRYRLARFRDGDGADSPFFMLNALDHDLSFPLIAPESVGLDYRPAVGRDALAALGARSARDLVALLIVTVRDRLEEITVNLQGPLVVHPATARGLQLVAEDYPLRHPLIAGVR
ncbi:MAG TPA: flagellar assembly protein FliW [candidate division Zixibacteria bacterium]|nr:flagellar assembly protein FliW [candidate division Zixibacteria bacterium]